MSKVLTGGCCCGNVSFTVIDDFSRFYFCHCDQCRKFSGSAYASNLFTDPDNINWLKGLEHIKRFDYPERTFSNAFCTECGSVVPYLTQSGKALIVPAGSLNQEPSKQLDAKIFCAEQATWQKTEINAAEFLGFPS